MSWPMFKIGDLCTLMTGGTPSTSEPEYYEGGTVPWIVSGDIHKQEIFDCEKKITSRAVDESNVRYLPRDSVLIALNGQGKTRGTVAMLRMEGATCNQSIVSIAPNSTQELFSDYLFYYLKSQYKNIRNITGDKDRAGLNMPLIREITIPLPPLPEQKCIAAILDKAEAIRRKRQQAIQLADDFLRAVFLDMFGDPVTNPKGWEIRSINEVCSDIVDCVNKTAPTVDYLTPYKMIRTTNVRNYTLDTDNVRYVNEETYKNWVRRLTPEIGDIVFTREAPAGEAAVIVTDDKIFLGQRTMHFRPIHAIIFSDYLLFELMGSGVKNQINKMHAGSTVTHLSVPECKKFKIRVPPFELQKQFESIKKAVLRVRELGADASDKYLFESVSQKAFSGQL